MTAAQPPGTDAAGVEVMDRSWPICRWCLERKPPADFDGGHVIPQAFGKFDGNLVLRNMECKVCNAYFGKHLEPVLARDSKEGLDRIEHGLVTERKGGRRLCSERITFTTDGGPCHGASLEVDPEAPSDAFLLRPARQIGFSSSSEGPFTWYRPEDVPPAEELRAQGVHAVAAGSMSTEELIAFLGDRGIRVEERGCLVNSVDPDGKLATTMHGRIDRIIKRAIAKIAFGYFVHEYPGLALLEQFHEIRRYVRHGEDPSFEPLRISTKPIIGSLPPNIQVVAHAVTVRWNPQRGRVVAQVTLFGWLQYQVTLSNAPFLFPPICVDSGHAFNPYGKQVVPLTRDRRLAGRVPLVAKEEWAELRAAADRAAVTKASQRRPRRIGLIG